MYDRYLIGEGKTFCFPCGFPTYSGRQTPAAVSRIISGLATHQPATVAELVRIGFSAYIVVWSLDDIFYTAIKLSTDNYSQGDACQVAFCYHNIRIILFFL